MLILVKKKRKLKKRAFICIFSVVLIFVMSINIVSTLSKVVLLNQEKKILKGVLVEKQDEKAYLEGEMTRLEDDEYVARYAREKYLFSKKGEYIIKIQK